MAGAGFGDRLARGNSKAAFTTGVGVTQDRWDAAFAPAEPAAPTAEPEAPTDAPASGQAETTDWQPHGHLF
jgi:hypothetical protein